MYTPLDVEKQRNGKTLIFSVVGLSSISTNDTIYLYGGKTSENTYNNNIWYISSKDVSLNVSPTLFKSRQNDLMLAAGAIVNNSIIAICSNVPINTNRTLSDTIASSLSVCSFDLNATPINNTWATIPSASSIRPSTRNKEAIAVAPDQSRLFIFGGQNIMNQKQSNESSQGNDDFWTYSIQSTLWSILPSPFTENRSRCGHTTTMLR